MKFNLFSELSYEVFSPATFIFNIQAARLPNQEIIKEALFITPAIEFEEFSLNNDEARFIKLAVNQGTNFTISYKATVDLQCRIIDETNLLKSIPIAALNKDVIPYLFPSRHCQSDKLRKLANKEFGHLPNEYAKVVAINEWIFNNTDYISGTTDSGTSAIDTLIQHEGVCKDFAHLGIALCRSLDIPARYITGYGYNLQPPDFHACFEAYLGGNWIFFDPTKMVALNGFVKIANAKDAAEAAVASFFGNTNCTYMNVQCSTTDESFNQFMPAVGKIEALSYQ
jgi:transglutaminase-like putative cysteine protease